MLANAFRKYPSFQKAHVVMDKGLSKNKGYGFVSFSDAHDFVRAMKEMNGKYIGSKPISLKKSEWKKRTDEKATKKITKRVMKQHQQQQQHRQY